MQGCEGVTVADIGGRSGIAEQPCLAGRILFRGGAAERVAVPAIARRAEVIGHDVVDAHRGCPGRRRDEHDDRLRIEPDVFACGPATGADFGEQVAGRVVT